MYPASGVGQFEPILVFVELPGIFVTSGVPGILEIVQVKIIVLTNGFIQLQPLAYRRKVINEPDEVSVSNRDSYFPPGGNRALAFGIRASSLIISLICSSVGTGKLFW